MRKPIIVRGKIVLRAIKPIRPDDEITYDYGKEYFDLFFRPARLPLRALRRKEAQRQKGFFREPA